MENHTEGGVRVDGAVRPRLYALCFGFAKQRELIDKHCYGDCGKAIIGAMYDPEIGELVPCRHEKCPHLDAEMPEPFGTINGEDLIMRKLK